MPVNSVQSVSSPLRSARAYKRGLVYGAPSALALLLSWSAPSCTTNEGDVNNYYSLGGAPSTGGSDGTGGDGYKSYLPACLNLVDFEDLEIDLFGEDGHRFYFEISPEARIAGDAQQCNFGHDVHGSVYTLGEDNGACPIPAINVRVLPVGSKSCADTGEVEVDLPGQSSFRTWSEIPNIKLDVGEFQDLVFPSGDRQVRMNNGQADSTIVREAVALRIWAALDYPAPKTRFVQTQSNIWDTEVRPGVSASHVMVQSYKASFFAQTLPSVQHVWEGAGDPFAGDCGPWGCGGDWGGDIVFDEAPFGQDAFPPQRGGFSGDCQWSVDEDCDEEAFAAIIESVTAVPQGPGFMEATAEYIDWPMLHKNQCLAALTGTGDDWIHNSNNVVIALLDTGKIVYLPYSVDISGGHPWYPQTPYDGYSFLTMGCQQDPDCREQALDTCEEMIDEFEAIDVATSIVDERCDALKDAGLDRKPDEAVCVSLRTFYENRPDELRQEIEYLRAGGGGGWGGQMVGDGDFDGGLR